jgi:hypothetical protein
VVGEEMDFYRYICAYLRERGEFCRPYMACIFSDNSWIFASPPL